MTSEVARAQSPRGEVVLRSRPGPDGPVLELRVNGVFVMDTLETTSERALATAALDLVDSPRDVLVGGLGLGFTARELLADPRLPLVDGRVDVVEIEEALIGWTRDGTVPSLGMLDDPRLRIIHADVAEHLARVAAASYDLVLLDVDNGPGYLVYDDNAAVYREPFLRTCQAALREGGTLVIWAANEAPDLLTAMESVFGAAAERAIEVRLGDRDDHYFLYVAR